MLKKIIINLILLFFVFWLSFTFFSSRAIYFNPFLVILVYLLMFSESEIQLLWILGAGILFDLFSALPFGSHLIIFCLLFLGGTYLLEHFFTKRAFSTMVILILIVNSVFLIFLQLEKILLGFFNVSSPFVWNWSGVLLQILSNLIIGAIMFAVTKFFTSRLRMNTI
ncbi:MAG: hypothetical protein PHT40_01125 [Patescibacteria group bacterium]|nr:hypothetical protein [Patescibacteria group bacterium]